MTGLRSRVSPTLPYPDTGGCPCRGCPNLYRTAQNVHRFYQNGQGPVQQHVPTPETLEEKESSDILEEKDDNIGDPTFPKQRRGGRGPLCIFRRVGQGLKGEPRCMSIGSC